MNFSTHLRQLASPIWEAQLHHPFVQSLGKGTLPLKKFQYYILQDARYLEELAKIFAAGAAKADDAETAIRFAQLVEETIVVERSLHESYGKQWKLTIQDMRSTPLSPTNYAYCRHMRSIAQTGTLGEITVVALPCAWVYCEVGQHLLRKGPPQTFPSLSRMVGIIWIPRIRQGGQMDAKRSQSVCQNGRKSRKDEDGRSLSHQFTL